MANFIIDKHQEVFDKNLYFAEYVLKTEMNIKGNHTYSVINDPLYKNQIGISEVGIADLISHLRIQGSSRHINACTFNNIEEIQFIHSMHALYDRSNHSFYINTDVKQGELDMFLAFLPNGADESLFEPTLYKKFLEGKEERELKTLIDRITQYKNQVVDTEISNLYERIREYKDQIQKFYNEIQTLSTNRISKLTDEKENTLNVLKMLRRHKAIHSIAIQGRELQIKTHPLRLQYIVNEHLKDRLDLSNARSEALIDKRLEVDEYIINLDLGNRRIGYEMYTVGDVRNEHWSRYHCLGNFEPKIIELCENYDILNLVYLLLQYLQTVDVADTAGRQTIEHARIMEE